MFFSSRGELSYLGNFIFLPRNRKVPPLELKSSSLGTKEFLPWNFLVPKGEQLLELAYKTKSARYEEHRQRSRSMETPRQELARGALLQEKSNNDSACNGLRRIEELRADAL